MKNKKNVKNVKVKNLNLQILLIIKLKFKIIFYKNKKIQKIYKQILKNKNSI